MNRSLHLFCLALGVGCLVVIDIFVAPIAAGRQLGGDYAVFWAAARAAPADIYNAAAITSAQAWTGIVGIRPFVSPPSFLLWFWPFGLLPFRVGLALWTVLGLGLFWFAYRRFVPARAMMLGLAGPAVLLAVFAGQVTLIVGALMAWALDAAGKRPALAGGLLGLAATIKPQALVLAPLGLLAAREYRTLIWAVAMGLAVGLASVAIQGSGRWLEWPAALRSFSDLVAGYGAQWNYALPAEVIYGPLPLRLAFAGLGIAAVWLVFRYSEEPARRMAALATGYLLCSPYALVYEMAMLAPVAAMLLLDEEEHPLVWLGAALVLAGLGRSGAPAWFAVALIVQQWGQARAAAQRA